MKIKEKVKNLAANINEKKSTVVAAAVPVVATALSVGASAAGETSASFEVPSIASVISADMFSGLLKQVTDLLPLLLPVMVAFLGVRKGISFLRSMLVGM